MVVAIKMVSMFWACGSWMNFYNILLVNSSINWGGGGNFASQQWKAGSLEQEMEEKDRQGRISCFN